MSRPLTFLASPFTALFLGMTGAVTVSAMPLIEGLLLGGPCLLTALVLILRHQGVVEPRNLEALGELDRELQGLRQRLSVEDQLHRGILNQLREGVLLLGPDRGVRLYNPAAQVLLSSSSHVTAGGSLVALFREPESLRMLDLAFQGETAEWNLRRDPRVLRLRALPFPFQGEGQGVLLTLDDITRQEALETTRQKFISNASHELKTPVTGIRIAAENLLDAQEVLPSGEPNLQAILRATDRMKLLLDDISELSRIETGALRLEREHLRVAAFTEQLLADHATLARTQGVDLETLLHPSVAEAEVFADPLRLDQLLGNLLANAIKFSPAGTTVRFEAALEGDAVVWRVADQGPGIPAAELKRIFERFYRAPAARAVPGTGLGLAIVKHLALLMGGEVGVESELGRGSTFTLRLPRQAG